MLRIEKLTTGYSNHNVIQNISFEVKNGETLCIIGPNGCGKSTLLRAINNIKEYSGKITYNQINIKDVSNIELGKIIGLLSQNKSGYFSYSIYDTVAMGGYATTKGLLSVKTSHQKVMDALKLVDLDSIYTKRIDQLSGGQYQRAMIARLIVQNPDIIMLDEPTNHLDLKHQIEIISFIKKWVKNDNKIGIIVLHDLNLVYKYADKVLLLDNNDKYYFGTPKDILTNENLEKVYNVDVKSWMNELLNLWNDE